MCPQGIAKENSTPRSTHAWAKAWVAPAESLRARTRGPVHLTRPCRVPHRGQDERARATHPTPYPTRRCGPRRCSTGVALPQQPGQQFTAGHVTTIQETIQETQQRVEPERLLPGRRSILLLAVRDRDGGIEVGAQPRLQVRAGARGPRRCPRPCSGGTDRREVLLGDPVQHPPGGRHRGDRTEQVL